MIAAEDTIDSDARNHADCQPDQDLRVQRPAFRLIGRLFVQVGCYLAFDRIALDSFSIVVFFRPVFTDPNVVCRAERRNSFDLLAE